jgi:hypothetical protein
VEILPYQLILLTFRHSKVTAELEEVAELSAILLPAGDVFGGLSS